MKEKQPYRRIIVLILLVAIGLQSFSKAIYIADYYVNNATYLKNCENKAKPKLQCNGKCQVKKKMQEEEKKEQENPDRKLENKTEIIISSKSFFATQLIQPNKVNHNHNKWFFDMGIVIDRSSSIFHPPQQA